MYVWIAIEFHKYMKNKAHILVNKTLRYRMRKSTENQPVARYSVDDCNSEHPSMRLPSFGLSLWSRVVSR